MSRVRLKLDLAGTRGDEVWRALRHFDQILGAAYAPAFGSSGPCRHRPEAPHSAGEWVGAEITVANPLLAQYAVSHYFEQEHVLDADVQQEVQP